MISTVVVGAGSSGGALAARLSEDPSQRVILIEAGPDQPGTIPDGLRNLDVLDIAGFDWGLLAHTGGSMDGDPTLRYLRGRVVGGSSTVTSAAMRPLPEDFDAWVTAAGESWSWAAVLPYFRKLENDLDYGDDPIHGTDGPISIKRHPREQWSRLLQAFEDACIHQGHPLFPDSNGEHGTGVGPAPRGMLADGDRASTLSTYLRSARSRPNLEIRADTYVERVIFDGRRAIGVEARHRDEDRVEPVLADRVVLCAGALKTPQILMLSGIGPRKHLSDVGIEPLVDLPVGRTLADHPSFNLIGPASDQNPDHFGPRAHLQYSSGGSARNDLWVRAALVAAGPPLPPFPPEVKGIALLSGVLGRPRSTGTLSLASADPAMPPVIRLNYLADDIDRGHARTMVRKMHRMATDSPLASEISTVLQPAADTVADDGRLDAWLRDNVGSAYHAACTCPMGRRDSGTAVVDPRLAVHETEALYVADASVFPEIPTNATNLACIMLGERLADWLKQH